MKTKNIEQTCIPGIWCFCKKTWLHFRLYWDTRIVSAFKPGKHGVVVSECELTAHVCDLLQIAQLFWLLWRYMSNKAAMIERGLMPPWHLSLIFSVPYNLGSFRFCQKGLITQWDHCILCFYQISGLLVQSLEDSIKTRRFQAGYVCAVHLHFQLSGSGDKITAEKGTQRWPESRAVALCVRC